MEASAVPVGRKKLTSLACQLSDWEVVEAYQEHRRGTTMDALAGRYGVSYKTLERAFARMRAKWEEMSACRR